MAKASKDNLADLKREAKKSGITGERLRDFKAIAAERDELYGDVPGLFYINLANGGSWRLRYTDPTGVTGKRITATIASGDKKPSEAKDIAQEWRVQIRKGIDPRMQHRLNEEQKQQAQKQEGQRRLQKVGVFFEEVYAPHITAMSVAPRHTLGSISRDFGHLFGRDMTSISVTDVREWESQRRAEGMDRGSMYRALAAFKAMLGYAAGTKRGDQNETPVIPVNPLAGVGLTKPTAVEREAIRRKEEQGNNNHLLNAEDFRRIDAVLAEQARLRVERRRRNIERGESRWPPLEGLRFPFWFEPFYRIARLTGARPGDVLRFKWSDIQTDSRTGIKVLRFTPRKTEHHETPVQVVFPLAGELLEIITEWRRQAGEPQTGLLFPSRSGGVRSSTSYQDQWHTVREAAGLPEGVAFYSLRHTFISERVNAGWHVLKLAKLVGHRDGSMIAKNYYREDLDDLAQMIEAMEATA